VSHYRDPLKRDQVNKAFVQQYPPYPSPPPPAMTTSPMAPGPITQVQGPITRVQGPITRVQGPITRVQGPITRVQGPITKVASRPGGSSYTLPDHQTVSSSTHLTQSNPTAPVYDYSSFREQPPSSTEPNFQALYQQPPMLHQTPTGHSSYAPSTNTDQYYQGDSIEYFPVQQSDSTTSWDKGKNVVRGKPTIR
jgi:hypothetical protein